MHSQLTLLSANLGSVLKAVCDDPDQPTVQRVTTMKLQHSHTLHLPSSRAQHRTHWSQAQPALRHRPTCHTIAKAQFTAEPASKDEKATTQVHLATASHVLLATTAACCFSLLLMQPSAAEELSIAFPASASNPEIRAAQKTLVESWAYVDTLYVDPANHADWGKALQDALAASFKASNAREVDEVTKGLLAQIDPYTRLLLETEMSALAAEQTGKIVATGLGLQQLSLTPPAARRLEQQQQLLVVSFVVDDSPAAEAGVKEGDVVLTVDGVSVAGKELRDVYKQLAKETVVTLARPPQLPDAPTVSSSNAAATTIATSAWNDITGDMGAATDGVLQGVESFVGNNRYTVHLKPAPLEFEPVQYGIIDLDRKDRPSTDGANLTSQPSGSSFRRAGYLRLLTFSATAPQAVAEALLDIQQEASQEHGLAGLIVDLRDNPGGIVEAGVEIAQDFLHAGQVLCIAVDKSGQEERVLLPEAHTLTELPLVVLVNQSTASTSELLAGALHDELKAPLIGTTTYGKGRSQRVIRLSDGKSTLLVSTLKYFTPHHSTIDKVGLTPDVVCRPEEVQAQQWVGGRLNKDGQDAGSLLDDPCIKLAAHWLAGMV